MLFHNAQVMAPTGRLPKGWLLVDGTRIAAMGAGDPPEFSDHESIDAQGLTLLPGFVDIHVHGGGGAEAMDATPDALRTMARLYAQHGVTAFTATTWTDSDARITAALEVILEVQGRQPDGATLLGAYLEGPYLNPIRCGAQSTVHIRTAPRDEATAYLDMGVIRLVALAPEFEENGWLIEECVRRGITVSAAHTAATYDQMVAAVARGLTHATHSYNAMTGLHHREPGTLGAVMALPEIRAELIADNIHVHPASMRILYKAKGPDGLVLITDAMRGAGMPEGEYPIDERTVIVKDGAVRLPDGTLAGSILSLDRALHNLMQATGESLDVLWPTSSLNAARQIHVADRKSSLEVGKDADLVLVDADVNVRLTVAEGTVVHRAEI
ncbi:N-acetylglucosamine-6-phosphate deacetylase [Aggregatilinea lenta]|uniref:N-acetylglucosamine-6-phosphate deacetylase n=1 Tax=Aggregatilinea lenta TaxID=913108 RepID=UPI000E5B40C8|nr:N-acetylglucosamine-6-phosphate deacetylase [Aggregatilinea lenta]